MCLSFNFTATSFNLYLRASCPYLPERGLTTMDGGR